MGTPLSGCPGRMSGETAHLHAQAAAPSLTHPWADSRALTPPWMGHGPSPLGCARMTEKQPLRAAWGLCPGSSISCLLPAQQPSGFPVWKVPAVKRLKSVGPRVPSPQLLVLLSRPRCGDLLINKSLPNRPARSSAGGTDPGRCRGGAGPRVPPRGHTVSAQLWASPFCPLEMASVCRWAPAGGQHSLTHRPAGSGVPPGAGYLRGSMSLHKQSHSRDSGRGPRGQQ